MCITHFPSALTAASAPSLDARPRRGMHRLERASPQHRMEDRMATLPPDLAELQTRLAALRGAL